MLHYNTIRGINMKKNTHLKIASVFAIMLVIATTISSGQNIQESKIKKENDPIHIEDQYICGIAMVNWMESIERYCPTGFRPILVSDSFKFYGPLSGYYSLWDDYSFDGIIFPPLGRIGFIRGYLTKME